jgi:NTE family protein
MSKTSIVLSGGGVKGSFQAGVLKALYDEGALKEAIAVYGTSVGAINAALLGFAPEKIEPVWRTIKQSDILDFNLSTLLLRSNGIYNLNPLRKNLKEKLGMSSWLTVHPCYADLINGSVLYGDSGIMPRETLIEFVLASSAIPAIMEPIGTYIDGGTRQQTPLKKAIDDGAERLIVVLCNPWTADPTGWTMPSGFFSFIEIGLRGIDLLEHQVFRTDVQLALELNQDPRYRNLDIQVYAPDREWMGTIEFDSKKINLAFDAGLKTAISGPLTSEELST